LNNRRKEDFPHRGYGTLGDVERDVPQGLEAPVQQVHLRRLQLRGVLFRSLSPARDNVDSHQC
jgi:hypothetical protein